MPETEGYLGVSPPLSTDPPSDLDNKLADALMNELKAQNNFESQQETDRRSVIRKTPTVATLTRY